MVDTDERRWFVHVPFLLVHVAAVVGAIWLGWSWNAFAWLAATYTVRMLAITIGYHRYFAHRAFKTNRALQFMLALAGVSAAQQGPLWWASHHRRHHKHSDQPDDVHSPRQRGFWWAHIGWTLQSGRVRTDYASIRDLARYPELRFLDDHHLWFAIGYGVMLFVVGGWPALVWGHFVSLVASWHVTFCINSLAHVWGRRRYATDDDSRNNAILALLTFGEGWHNNHHYYQRSARQGFYWWEIDVSYYLLKLLELARLVRDVDGIPPRLRDARTIDKLPAWSTTPIGRTLPPCSAS
jgi:stearoyl-CoA desaturase (delta-9 desaturase)